jgi:hypothetical protein
MVRNFSNRSQDRSAVIKSESTKRVVKKCAKRPFKLMTITWPDKKRDSMYHKIVSVAGKDKKNSTHERKS